MKAIILAIIFFILACSNLNAQKRTFLRIYDLEGKRFEKGYFAATTDNGLQLTRQKDRITIPYEQIGAIYTRRSGGNSMLIGGATGFVTLGGLAASGGESNPEGWFSYTPAQGFLVGGIIGATAGTAVGGIISAMRKKQVYYIHGVSSNWEEQRIILNQLPVRRQ